MRALAVSGLLLCTPLTAHADLILDITQVTIINGGPAYGVSSDGTYVAGGAYLWSAGVTQQLPGIAGASLDYQAGSVSDNGIVYGYATALDGLHAPVRWVNGQIAILPRPIVGAASGAGAATSDGQAALITSYVGRSTRWTPTNISVVPPAPGMPETSVYAFDMTPDGQRIAGRAGNQAAVWYHPSATPLQIGTLPGHQHASATAIANDATALAGSSYYEAPPGQFNSGYHAFRWTPTDGMVALGDLPGGNVDSQATGISGDGQIVVGYSSAVGAPAAFVWTDAMGMVNLNDLPGNPLVGTGWTMRNARAVSTDGSTIVGMAYNPAFGVHGFVATIGVVPAPPTLALLMATPWVIRRRR